MKYLYKFLKKKIIKHQYSLYFCHTYFDVLHHKANILNETLSAKPEHKTKNTQLIINFSNPVMNKNTTRTHNM